MSLVFADQDCSWQWCENKSLSAIKAWRCGHYENTITRSRDFRFLNKAETSSLFDFMHNKESRTKIPDAELGNFIPLLNTLPQAEIIFQILVHVLRLGSSISFGKFSIFNETDVSKSSTTAAHTVIELLLFFNDTKGRNLIYYLLDYSIRLTKMASLPNYVHKTHTCFLPYRFCCVHCVHDIRKAYSVKPTCGQGFLPQRSLVLRKVNYHQSYIVWRLMHEWRLKLSRFHYSDWLRNHKRNHWQFCKLTAFFIAISISIKYCTLVLYLGIVCL